MSEDAIAIALPFTGRWRVENSPARRVPSHGTDLFAGRYAIDFVGVNDRRRTAEVRDWRTFLATEPPGRFVGFGRPILAPVTGTVVATHDSEPDHEARRSQPALFSYALTQASRARAGWPSLAGNHVIIARPDGLYVALAHLRSGSVRVHAGRRVSTGDHLGTCGNSGNSTQPHVHVQAMDAPDPATARGVPIEFRDFREWGPGTSRPHVRDHGVPGERSIIEPRSK